MEGGMEEKEERRRGGEREGKEVKYNKRSRDSV